MKYIVEQIWLVMQARLVPQFRLRLEQGPSHYVGLEDAHVAEHAILHSLVSVQ